MLGALARLATLTADPFDWHGTRVWITGFGLGSNVRALLVVMVCLLALPVLARQTLREIYDAVPAPPAQLDTAVSWVRDAQIVTPEWQETQSRIAAASQAVESDAAPSPNPAAIATCVAGYQAYQAANAASGDPAGVLAKRLAALAQGYAGLKQRTATRPDLLLDIREQELASYGALFADWKAKRAAIVARGQRELLAAGEASAIDDPKQRAAVIAYKSAMLDEVRALASITHAAVMSAADVSAGTTPSRGPGPTTLWDLMSDPQAPKR